MLLLKQIQLQLIQFDPVTIKTSPISVNTGLITLLLIQILLQLTSDSVTFDTSPASIHTSQIMLLSMHVLLQLI